MRAVLLWMGSMMLLAGCSASHEGDGDTGSAPRDARVLDAPLDVPRDAPVRADGELPDVRLRDVGMHELDGEVWEGYVESHSFPSGSDRVRIVFDAASGDGPRTGIVVFGDGAPPPPVTDPYVGYPPGRSSSDRQELFEGLEYRITEASVMGDRVQITIDASQLYEVWCQLQTPYLQELGSDFYRCRPPSDGGGSTRDACYYVARPGGAHVEADCDWLALCDSSVCACTAAGCLPYPGATILIDFHITGDDGDGSMPLGNIHLNRM